uniref:Protein ovary overexpressed n=1 Tax=Rhipicephalus microplus TaxID=6941 RepID=A0A6M2CRJ4_RHIMP
MKWWCLFLIKDAPTWKPDSPKSHLLPLIPSREVHFAILPFLLSPCEELQAFWKTFQLDSFQSALQSWSDDIAGLKDTYHFPSHLSPAVLTSATKRIEGLLDNLPIPGRAMLEIVVDRSLFSDLDVKDNVMLYGALFRAYMWHHATFRPLGVGSSIQMNKWINGLTVTGWDLQKEWLSVWKGRFNDGNTTTACHFELQCFVGDTYARDLKPFLPHFEKPRVMDYYSLLSLGGLVWSTSIEVLDDFSFSSLPMHLIVPTLFRFVSLSSVQALPACVLKKVNESKKSCVILRLSYWDDVDMKAKPSTSSSTDWQHNLLMEKPCQSASVGDQCHQEPSGHLHFILMAADNMNIVYPLRKTPPFPETCLHSGQESASLPPAVGSATSELMQEIPLVCTDRILDSLQDDDSLSLASVGDIIASDESFREDVEELEKSLDVLKSVESDRATDSAEESCLSSPDDMTYASLGDPSDWPERRFLVSESLKSSASSENCTLSNAGGCPGLKELTISAAEIAKLFEESGRPKRNPLHPVHAVGQSTRPSVSWDQLESTQWPDILQCKYHDVYYNTDHEVLENSCSAMKEQYLVNETAATCTSNPESSVLLQSKSKKPSSTACVPVNKDRTTLQGHQQKHSFSSTRNDPVASTPLQRSPQKESMSQKTVPLTWNSPQAAASSFPRKSPRKNTKQHECDDPRKERIDANRAASEKLRMKLRVAVANALEKNGVSQSSPLYKACGKKLFAICSTFAKDLIGCGRTSELLQNIADSHAKQVVNFEMLKPGICKSETSEATE